MAITHPTAALATPFEGHTHFVPVPSELWSDTASVLVTAAIAPTLAAIFDYAATSCSNAVSATSTDGTPVHCAALH
jgi:hypothetical protein